MAHDDRCGGARKSGCRCSGCAGSLHGWPGALRAVHTPSRQKHAPSPYAGLTYIETARSRHGKATTHRRTVEVADQARDNIISWLATGFEDPPDTAAKFTSQIAERIADKVSDDLFKTMARESAKLDQLEQWRKTVNNHFLCTLFASLSCEIMDLESWLGMQKEHLISVLATAAKPRSFISDALVRLAATIVVDEVIQLAQEVSHYNNFKRALRLSAIMSCPDPTEHEAVLKCCVIPLEKGIISVEVKRELLQALPTPWRAESA
jgi:hypothetical protein